MLDFRRLVEFLFKSFRVSRDTEQVQSLIEGGQEHVMLVKRSFIYGVFSSLLFVPLLALTALNVLLAHWHFEGSWDGYTVMGVLVFNALFSLASSARYIMYFRSTYAGGSRVRATREVYERLLQGDRIFASFFNQASLNMLLFVGVIAYYVVHIVFVTQFSSQIWAVVDIACIVAEFVLLQNLTRSLINLEMDYVLVIPGKLYFVNQRGFYTDIQSLDADKIKTIRLSFPNFIASFFHYGTVDVLTEGDEGLIGVMTMQYVDYPEESVKNMELLLDDDVKTLRAMYDEVHNAYLRKIIAQCGFDPKNPEFRLKIQGFLRDYDTQIRDDYLAAADESTKREIREIYERYSR